MAAIKLDFAVKQVENIQELQSLYGIQFYLTAIWKDSRLKFSNLRPDLTHNQLSDSEESMVWTPALIFEKTLGAHPFGIEHGAKIQVERNSVGEPMPIISLHEGTWYSGSDTPLKMFQYFKFDHNCHFKLNDYPFDSQHCELKVSSFLNFWQCRFTLILKPFNF